MMLTVAQSTQPADLERLGVVVMVPHDRLSTTHLARFRHEPPALTRTASDAMRPCLLPVAMVPAFRGTRRGLDLALGVPLPVVSTDLLAAPVRVDSLPHRRITSALPLVLAMAAQIALAALALSRGSHAAILPDAADAK
jgi:hypothetical protein